MDQGPGRVREDNRNRKSRRILFALLLPALASGWFLAGGDAAAQGNACTTATCHEKLLRHKTVHPVTSECEGCHTPVETPHPQPGKKTFTLTQAVPELCSNCHDAFGKKADVHPPVKDGECATCHDPHASDQAKLLTAPVKDLCATCHPAQTEFKTLHGPVGAGDCTACHTPHESEFKPLLVRLGSELCFNCHGEVEKSLTMKDVHPALKQGCTACHNPHGSANAKLLVEDGEKLCYKCHGRIADIVQKSPRKHKAVVCKNSCVACHSPHATDNERLMLKPEKEMCLSCHAKTITADMTVLHEPVKEGKCSTCHSPFGSHIANLLLEEFPEDIYVAYSEKKYALCFNCHNADLVQYPDTSFATSFRDGEANLHYLHVHKPKGRNCNLCHNVHGSAGPDLIPDSVSFGKWTLPLKFKKTENGGSCSPGCHKPASYDRLIPVKKPGETSPPEAASTPGAAPTPDVTPQPEETPRPEAPTQPEE